MGPGGRAPGGGQGAKPPAADEVFVFKTVIFNASATVLHEMVYCLSCFLCKISKYSQRTKIKITRRRRLRQTDAFSALGGIVQETARSRCRRLSGRLFHSSIVLRFMDSQSEFAL